MSTENKIVEIEDLNVVFATDGGPVTAVAEMHLDVGPKEIVAIVGESGSGKSVTAKTILGMLPSTASLQGKVMLLSSDGAQMLDLGKLGKRELQRVRGTGAAMVFQEPNAVLNPVFKVGWQLAEGVRAHRKIDKKQARALAIEYLELVGIPDPEVRVDYYPHQFSGGQKQRIVIAMALALQTKVIIADEPTTALDVTVQAEILQLLRDSRDRLDASILLITHNMGVVADLADRVLVMRAGELLEEKSVEEIFAAPEHPYTEALMEAVPKIGAREPRVLSETEASGKPVVEADNLVIEYPGRLGKPGFTAVKGVDLSIRPGEVLGLVGESGSGKTTIGRAIAGLTEVTGGSLQVLGHEMRGLKEREFRPLRRQIGFVFQDPGTSFDPLQTIAQGIAEPLIIHGEYRTVGDASGKIAELLRGVQLPVELGARYPHELSGGQRQRASLARALALEPKLLVADEPTSALDVTVQARILDLFRKLQQEHNFAVLFITHDLAVVDMLAHRVAVLYQGEIVEEGNARQVLTAPEHSYTQRLLASLPVPDPKEQAERRQRWMELAK